MTRSVVEYPSAVLRSQSVRVDRFDANLSKLVEDMFDCMRSSNGVGLAAPQIEELLSILVMDPSAGTDTSSRSVLVNPKITWRSREKETLREGCLSLPGKVCKVQRHAVVEVEYQDITGKTHTKTFSGFEARIVQHEIDHLSGILMTDVSVKTKNPIIEKREVAA